MVYRSSRRPAQRAEGNEEFENFTASDLKDDMEKSVDVRRTAGLWRVVAIVFIILSVIFLIALIVVASKDSSETDAPLCGHPGDNPSQYQVDLTEPSDPGPFHDLTRFELERLRVFLQKDPQIKAVEAEKAGMTDSSIFVMDLYPPPKTSTLRFLDKASKQPPRQARVLVYRGDIGEPVVEEYICSPLPNVKECKLLQSKFRRNPVEYSLRPLGPTEVEAIQGVVLKLIDSKIRNILIESFGASTFNCAPKECLRVYPGPVASNLVKDIKRRRMWLQLLQPLEYYGLHPVGMGFLANMGGSDPEKMTIDNVWYGGKMFESLEALSAAYNSSSTPKMKAKETDENEELYSRLTPQGEFVPKEPRRPPRMVEPDGRRYSLKDRQVEYLGWEFNFRMSALTGPSLFNVRYRGERIVYELGLSEIAVFYSGYIPMHRITDFVDSGVLLGTHSKSLVPGGDCPETATFINLTFPGQVVSKPAEIDRAFCLFENNNGYPLRRHLSYSAYEGGFYGGIMDSALTLRSILTVVNYDYVLDFIFHQNGALETRVMSTGYIYPTFFSRGESQYGFKIEEDIIGNMHHHMFNFKADVDIKGRSNRYETLDIIPDTVDFRLRPGAKYHQSRYQRSLKKSEKDALYKYDFNTPKYHIVHNDKSKTKFGAPKAYRILVKGMSKQLLSEGASNEGAIPWARHQIAVTKHNDDQQVSSSPYAMWDSYNPVTNFTTFYEDDESIVDEDLVFWITLGMHHIPHTEDLPLTPTVGNHLQFFLLPNNYFDICPSVRSRDHIQVRLKNMNRPDEGVEVDRNGYSDDQCLTQKLASDYDKLVEENPDIVLESRKFRGIF